MLEGGGTSYRGTSFEQDGRFSNKEKKTMRQMKFPPEFSQKVNIKKVELGVIKPWINRKVQEYLGEEDDVVINFILAALEPNINNKLDPRKI
mmetsp:Transcript_20041/g.17128  ORF Transcript_20041/g.17128 Transcript_20041/m.17128 type:complete len:92 (+) Transcript_20041:46-321(+)